MLACSVDDDVDGGGGDVEKVIKYPKPFVGVSGRVVVIG